MKKSLLPVRRTWSWLGWYKRVFKSISSGERVSIPFWIIQADPQTFSALFWRPFHPLCQLTLWSQLQKMAFHKTTETDNQSLCRPQWYPECKKYGLKQEGKERNPLMKKMEAKRCLCTTISVIWSHVKFITVGLIVKKNK